MNLIFNTVGVVGAGAMGRGIAQIATQAGSTVLLFDTQPDAVARDVRAALLHPRPVVYTPLIWGAVMGTIRTLPRAVMRRIQF